MNPSFLLPLDSLPRHATLPHTANCMFLINLTVLAAYSVLVVLPAYFAVFLQETIALKAGVYSATAICVVVGVVAYTGRNY